MRSGELTVKGLELALQRDGDPAGPPVLALHGWLDNSESFRRLSAELPEYHWHCLEFPGHGLSQHRPAGALYHISDYVSDAVGALDALEFSRATIVGHSLGAAIACLVAAAIPDRVDALVLIEGLGPLSADASKAVENLRTASRGLLDTSGRRRTHFPRVAHALAARRMATPDVDTEALRAIVERNLRKAGEGFEWRTDPRLKLPSPQPYDEESVLQLLAAIEAPVLLIEADAGYLAHRARFEKRRDQIARCRHIVIEGDHHLHTGPAAATIAAAVRQWRDEHGEGLKQ